MAWTVETWNDAVDTELEELPADRRARFRISRSGSRNSRFEKVRGPHVKHLRASLWEMRMKGKDGISRA